MFSIMEMAAKIGVPYYKITYAHQTGKLPEPLRWNGLRAYSEEDVERVREYFRARDGKSGNNGRKSGDSSR